MVKIDIALEYRLEKTIYIYMDIIYFYFITINIYSELL